MTHPKVSVVMGVFNGERYLREAVESILAQTFGDFEFIIIEDGSTDGTAEILSSYAKGDARIRVVSQGNTGRAEALNRGIALAKARYVARMDADDISAAYRFKDQVDFLDAHTDVGLIGGAYEQIDAKGASMGTVRFPLSDPEIREAMERDNPICHPAVMFRKAAAEAAGGYRKALLDADDYDLWLRMAERTRFANLGEVVLLYRIHPMQASVANMKHQGWCVLAARAAATLRRKGRPDPLAGVGRIDPQFLHSLGIKEAELERNFAGACAYWIGILRRTDPEAAIQINEMLAASSASASVLDRATIANLWLAAARMHYESGRFGSSVSCIGRGLLARPILAGRPIKRAFSRLAARFGN
jgi:hypothetical protein